MLARQKLSTPATPLNGDNILWPQFVKEFYYDFELGQHVLIAGQNGSGKTYLMSNLLLNGLNLGARVLVLWTKPRDKELTSFYNKVKVSKRIVETESKIDFKRSKEQFIILRPNADTIAKLKVAQTQEFTRALDRAWKSEGWIVYADELRYLVQQLRMSEQIQILYTQLRSSSVSLFAGIQRTRWATVETISESRHLLIGPMRAADDLKPLRGALSTYQLEDITHLPEHNFLYDGIEFSGIVHV